MHFASLAQVKAALVKTDATNDLFIENALNAIDARIVQLCNQQLFLTQKKLQFTRNGKTLKVIPNFPVFNIINTAGGVNQPYLANLQYTSNFPTLAGQVRTWTNVTGYWEFQPGESGIGGWRVYYEPGFYGGLLGTGLWGQNNWGGEGNGGDLNYLLTYAYGQPMPLIVLYTAGTGSGTFQISYNGTTSSAISYAASAATVQAAFPAPTYGTVAVAGTSLAAGFTITFSNPADALPVNIINPAGSTIIAATANASGVLNDVAQVETEWAAILFKESDILGLDGGRLGVNSTTDSTPMGISHTVNNKDLIPRWRMVLSAYTLRARAGW